MKAIIFLLAGCLAGFTLAGCKTTTVEHTWKNGEKTRIRDMRLLHEQEASFSFEHGTNGNYKVSASVASSADEDAMRAAFDAGLAAGKKIGKAAVVP